MSKISNFFSKAKLPKKNENSKSKPDGNAYKNPNDTQKGKYNLNNFKFNSLMSHLNIRGKLYLVILLILIFNMVTTTIFGQTLFGKLYTIGKNNELLSIQRQIKSSYLSNSDLLSQQLNDAEKKNITILIFAIVNETATVEYFSRSAPPPDNKENNLPPDMMERSRYNPYMWINGAKKGNIIDQLDEQDQNKVLLSNQINFSMRQDGGPGNRSIQIYSKIKDRVYLFLETPQEYIAQTANMAVRYMFYISLFTFVLALIILAYISKRITKPITNMQNVADKIANLNFSEKCVVESKDELGQLGTSINRMSETLQENIHRLTMMNEVLREDLKREEHTNQIRREFIANVSHDFKTPLSLITAYSEAIRDQSNVEMSKYCDIIISESNKMDGLVNQLLKLSQLENKMVVLNESMFDLTGLITETISQYQILMKAKNITVEFTDQQERIAYGDFYKMEQVLRNLLENAIKYSKQDGVVKIWVTKEDKFKIHIYNEVDNADEIDTDMLFVSFYKHDQSRSLEDKSYGLGLAIVKAIAELHGNQCGAYKDDKGLVFWIEIKEYTE